MDKSAPKAFDTNGGHYVRSHEDTKHVYIDMFYACHFYELMLSDPKMMLEMARGVNFQ